MNDDDLIKCPKCKSTQITANKRGYSLAKGAAGAVLTGGIGLVAGLHGSNRVKVQCLKCGFKWNPGEHYKSSKERTITPMTEAEARERKLERFYKIRSSGQVDYANRYALESGLINSTDEANILYESYTPKSNSGEKAKGVGCVIALLVIVALVIYVMVNAIK